MQPLLPVLLLLFLVSACGGGSSGGASDPSPPAGDNGDSSEQPAENGDEPPHTDPGDNGGSGDDSNGQTGDNGGGSGDDGSSDDNGADDTGSDDGNGDDNGHGGSDDDGSGDDSGGSDDGTGDDSSNGGAGDDSNGADDDDAPVSLTGTESLLVYQSDLGERVALGLPIRRQLTATNPDNPQQSGTVTPVAQSNRWAASPALAPPTGVSGFHLPLDRNFPLGLLAGQRNHDGDISDAHYSHTVYNSLDGHLFKLDTTGDSLQAERFSSESDATVVCAAGAVADFNDADNSRIVYQAANDADCAASQLRMVTLSDSIDTDPVILIEDLAFEGPLQGPAFHSFAGTQVPRPVSWFHGVYDGGDLVALLTFDNDTLRVHDLDDGSATTLADGIERVVAMLADVPGKAATVLQIDGTLMAYRHPDGLHDYGHELHWQTSNDMAAHHNGEVFIVDNNDEDVFNPGGDNLKQGQIVRVDPLSDSLSFMDESDHQNFWGVDVPLLSTRPMFRNATISDDHFAWAYWGPDNHWIVRAISIDPDATGGFNLLDDENVQFHPSAQIRSRRAPQSDSDAGWFIYTDNRAEEPFIVGLELDGNSRFTIDDARLIGKTWASELPGGHRQAEYLVYITADDQLKAREATDALHATEISLDMPPVDQLGHGHVAGFGPQTLLSLRASNGWPDVFQADLRDPGSFTRHTDRSDGGELDIPVAHY